MKYPIAAFDEISWDQIQKGDTVFIAGNLINGKPTFVYGPHYVFDIEKCILKNSSGTSFFERWPVLFKRKTFPIN